VAVYAIGKTNFTKSPAAKVCGCYRLAVLTYAKIMVLPELHACGFSKCEHVVKKEFNALPAKYVHHIDITARKSVLF
jgi:hypothetical protein